MEIFKKIYRNLAVAAGVLTLPAISSALIQLNPNMPMESLVEKSDEIIVGKVIEKNVVVEQGGIVSKYEVQVGENLKTKSKDFSPGRTISLSLAGGTPTSSPLTRYVPGMPHMFKGEDVVLFLRTQPTESQKAKNLVPKSGVFKTQIVGLNQGRFTIVEDSKGKKSVIRMSGEQQGLVNEGQLTAKTVDGIKKNTIRVKEQKLLRGRDLSKQATQKDPLELKAEDQQVVKKEAALQTGEMIRGTVQVGGIPAQDLESFKSDIRTFVVK